MRNLLEIKLVIARNMSTLGILQESFGEIWNFLVAHSETHLGSCDSESAFQDFFFLAFRFVTLAVLQYVFWCMFSA